MGFKITLITAIPNYVISMRNLVKWGIEEKGNLKIIRLWMPKLEHKDLIRRLLLYSWFSMISLLPILIYSRKSYLWAFAQRVFSTLSALPAKILFNVNLISDVTDVWPEALINTGYAKAESLFYRISKFFALIAYKCSDKIIVLNKNMKKLICKNYKLNNEKVYILENFSQEYLELPKFNDKLIILYYGNLGKNYDFDTIINLARELKDERIKFVIRGHGEMKGYILKAISENHLKNIELIDKVLDDLELKKLKEMSHILILPMREQVIEDASFPIKLVEYLHSSRPIIYIGNGFALELINSRKIGIGLKRFDKEKLLSFIYEIMKDNDQLISYSINAKKTAEEMFSRNSVLYKLNSIFS